jgi:hypothetical protein
VPRCTTVHARYHVGHPDEGLIEHATSRAEAFGIMRAWRTHRLNDWANKDAVTVFDVMARHGCAHLWGWFAGEWRELAYRL